MMQNALGRRGEQLFSVLNTRFYGRPQPIFRPQFLGDKWPVADFLVELTGDTLPVIPYFFAQIKTTRLGYDRQNRLRVQVTATELQNQNRLWHEVRQFWAQVGVLSIDSYFVDEERK